MISNTWKSTARMLLLIAAGIFSIGCTPVSSQVAAPLPAPPATTPESLAPTDSDPAKTSVSPEEVAPTDSKIAQNRPEQNSLPEIITGMEVGMPYAEARALIDPEIWGPKTHPPLDHISTSVQTMRDLGYEEVRDCAGTGLGLCRMEFIEREGLVLVIVVTTSEAEPRVWAWDVE
ncbi:MAG: hypothetical protein ACFB2W_03555 [Leptolyngbyaceae cyanobacterium]